MVKIRANRKTDRISLSWLTLTRQCSIARWCFVVFRSVLDKNQIVHHNILSQTLSITMIIQTTRQRADVIGGKHNNIIILNYSNHNRCIITYIRYGMCGCVYKPRLECSKSILRQRGYTTFSYWSEC